MSYVQDALRTKAPTTPELIERMGRARLVLSDVLNKSAVNRPNGTTVKA